MSFNVSPMRGRFFILCASVFTAALATVCNSLAAGPPRGRPIEFTAPSPTERTNLNHTARKTDGLKELQNGLIEPLSNIKPGGSLDGVPVPMTLPQPRTIAPAKDRAQELMELRKNWGLLDDAALKAQAERELSGEPSRADEKTAPETLGLSATDEFFYELLKADPSLTKLDDSKDRRIGSSKQKEEAEQSGKDQLMPQALKQSEEEFNQFMGSTPEAAQAAEAASSFQQKNPFRDFFKLGVQEKPSLSDENARKERMRDYQEIYGMRGGGLTAKEMFESITTPPATPAPALTTSKPFGDSPANSLQSPFITGPVGAPAGFSSALPIAGFPSLAGPALPAAPALIPKFEMPARSIPKAPVSFEAPRRPF